MQFLYGGDMLAWACVDQDVELGSLLRGKHRSASRFACCSGTTRRYYSRGTLVQPDNERAHLREAAAMGNLNAHTLAELLLRWWPVLDYELRLSRWL